MSIDINRELQAYRLTERELFRIVSLIPKLLNLALFLLDLEEILNARDAVRTQHPNAFFVPPSYQALVPGGQFEPVGEGPLNRTVRRNGVRSHRSWERLSGHNS
ncbi:607_t:CDS:2 [Dentiscutata erythropus]|uniref:607_t:CDS:1 n=1 Tax=Dentiscutata erythropus TaxID=1348616 RepID=A0A9N9FMH8_9GLOM|nr:607_t:CDS:2 [Dentiscutata erythropus]